MFGGGRERLALKQRNTRNTGAAALTLLAREHARVEQLEEVKPRLQEAMAAAAGDVEAECLVRLQAIDILCQLAYTNPSALLHASENVGIITASLQNAPDGLNKELIESLISYAKHHIEVTHSRILGDREAPTRIYGSSSAESVAVAEVTPPTWDSNVVVELKAERPDEPTEVTEPRVYGWQATDTPPFGWTPTEQTAA